MNPVHEVSLAVNAAHRFIYFAPESASVAAGFGVAERDRSYFAFRSAALGAVPWQVTHAAFYNFSPRAVQAMDGVWDHATPELWQAGRFTVAARALRRAGVEMTVDRIAAARALIDPVVAGSDCAGKPLAAANASVALPADPLVALWQQITVLREWRGDAHIVALAADGIGPCECNVLQTATGRLPTEIVRSTRGWTDDEWATATAHLAARGWLGADGTVTAAGAAARERVETRTDELCAGLWTPIGDEGALRLARLITPIGAAAAFP